MAADLDFNYDWIVEKELLAASLPTSVEDIKLLHQAGVKTIISLCDGYDVEQIIRKSKVNVTHLVFEIPDFSVPDESQVEEFLKYMEFGDKPVAIHCYAGIGRTGTMIAMYLIHKKGMGAREAIEFVRSRRYGAVESQVQEIFLFLIEKKIKQ
ncbi:MAG: protein-tyrosine phosphatase family protein [Candidatus Hodarchaeales archaeon]